MCSFCVQMGWACSNTTNTRVIYALDCIFCVLLLFEFGSNFQMGAACVRLANVFECVPLLFILYAIY